MSTTQPTSDVRRDIRDYLVPMLVAAAFTVVAVGFLAVVAATQGEEALAGALVGGLAVLGVLLFGVTTMAAVVKVAPGMAMLVAMSTYLLQVMVLLALWSRHQRDEEMQAGLSAEWLAGGIVTATVAWLAGHVLVAYRHRHVDEPWPSDPQLPADGDADHIIDDRDHNPGEQ